MSAPAVDIAVRIAADPARLWVGLPAALSVWLRPSGAVSRADGEIAVLADGAAADVVVTEDGDDLVTEVVEDGDTLRTRWSLDAHDDRTAVVAASTTGFSGDGDAHRERLETVLVALAAHLEHFPEVPGAEVHAWGPSRGRTSASTHEQAHARFLSLVGMIAPRQPLTTFRGVPTMAGTCLERRAGRHHSAALALLDNPVPGIVVLATAGTPPVHEIRALLFGDDATAERLQAQWSAWLAAT